MADMRLSFAFLLALLLPAARAADPDLLASYAQMRSAALDPNAVAVAENLVLKKEGATLTLKSGTLYALPPVLGRVPGAVFVGEGTFLFEPPNPLEQKNLARFVNNSTRLEEPFREAVFYFADSTFADLSAGGRFRAGAIDSHATSVLNDSRKTLREGLKINTEARVLAGLVSEPQSFFAADIRGQKHGKLLYFIDPLNGETVSLAHYDLPAVFDVWSAYTPAGVPLAPDRALVHTSRIDLDTQVDKRGKLEAEETSEFTGLANGPRMFLVQLAPSLRVSKVAWNDGTELKYIQEAKDKDAEFWVILPQPLARGEKYSWKITYAGDGVIHNAGSGNFFVGARDRWYPKPDVPGESFNDRSMYHLKFHHPKDMTLVATGRPVNKAVEGKLAVSEWETEVPYTVAGFNYGGYKTKTSKIGDAAVTVYANSELPDDLKELKVLLEEHPEATNALGITAGALNTTGIMDRTLAEASNALRLYTAYFGPLPFKSISVTQQPAENFGQSWPTLIFMPSTSFLDETARHQLGLDQNQRSRQFFSEVGSHEISHQWWGHLVSWSDYHDQWLSEGFAQFSAGLYQHRVAGEKKFKSFLETDREFILSALPQSVGRANDAGPIWMGTRLSTEKSPGAYRLIYAKGGFVLHMLRMMMYDYARGDDSPFIAMMKDFVQTNAGKGASTADFKAICDKHFGEDMSWFFRQWVYGTDIPKIGVEYSIKDAPDGPVLAVDDTQQNVPPDFRSVLPIVLHYKGGVLSARMVISQPSGHAEMKLKEKPDSVEFNPLYGLLCDLEVKKR
jgi:hypothetical protein